MTPWLRPVPAGRPFHQLDRTDVHHWWRPVVGLATLVALAVGVTVAFVLILFVAVWLLTGVQLEIATSGEQLFANDVANLVALLATLGLLLPLVWLVTVVVNRRWLGTLSSVEGHLRWRWLLLCLVPATGYIGLVFAASAGLDPGIESGHWPGWHAFWPPLLIIVLLVPFQASAEEYLFRGWLLQAVGSFTGEGRALGRVFGSPWPAIILSAAPFVAGHMYTDWGLVDIGAFAVIAGWVTVRTGGLEAAIALHVMNNMTGMILSASEGDLAIEQGAVPLPEVVIDVGAMLAWALAVVWMFGHTGSKRPMKRLS